MISGVCPGKLGELLRLEVHGPRRPLHARGVALPKAELVDLLVNPSFPHWNPHPGPDAVRKNGGFLLVALKPTPTQKNRPSKDIVSSTFTLVYPSSNMDSALQLITCLSVTAIVLANEQALRLPGAQVPFGRLPFSSSAVWWGTFHGLVLLLVQSRVVCLLFPLSFALHLPRLTNNLGKRTIELAEFLAQHGWALLLCNGGSVTPNPSHSPNNIIREQQARGSKGCVLSSGLPNKRPHQKRGPKRKFQSLHVGC